jgi:arabinogalactan oligomer/maltooligosaccharide transport system substrate-binding protein
MKKFLSILLIAILMVSAAACTPKQDATAAPAATTAAPAATTAAPAAGIEATISVQVESGWLGYYEQVKARVLEKNPKATINFIETGSFDHLDVLDQTNVTNPDVADVFALPADRIHGLSKNDALAPIDALAMAANTGGFGDYDGGLGGNFKIDGDYLAFPMNIETLINFANAANAAAAGVDLTKSIEFTELNPETMLIPVFNAWFGVAVTNSAGIEFLGKDANGNLFSDLTADWADLDADKQAVFKALFDYYKAHATANTSLWDSSAAWGYMDTSFTSGGNTAIRLEGPWSTGSLSNLANAGADLEILPIGQVTLNGKPLAHWKGGWGLGVNARLEGKDAQMALAQAFIEEIVNPAYAVDFFKATGKILENVDPSAYLNSDMSATDKEVVGAVIASYENAPARPLFTEWGSVWGTWETGMLSWAAVKPATVEAAYAEIQAAFKAMMLNF